MGDHLKAWQRETLVSLNLRLTSQASGRDCYILYRTSFEDLSSDREKKVRMQGTSMGGLVPCMTNRSAAMLLGASVRRALLTLMGMPQD